MSSESKQAEDIYENHTILLASCCYEKMTSWSELITYLPKFSDVWKRADVGTLRNSRSNASENLEQRSHMFLDQCVANSDKEEWRK